jgi:hypothetical protein
LWQARTGSGVSRASSTSALKSDAYGVKPISIQPEEFIEVIGAGLVNCEHEWINIEKIPSLNLGV